jgi:hypothetical protein
METIEAFWVRENGDATQVTREFVAAEIGKGLTGQANGLQGRNIKKAKRHDKGVVVENR